jgi:hypothetical protein
LYHAEPWDSICSNQSVLGRTLTAPEIGAAVSYNNGLHWYDLGIVLKADISTLRCDTENGYFSGGVGDPSIMLDPQEQYLYIFFGTYSGGVANQGVTVARMEWSDRYAPVGRVWRWFDGAWNSPGLNGTSTPIFPATVDWNLRNADAFWGPAIHWNTYLERYVILLNRTMNAYYQEEGVYISYSSDLSNPGSWTLPLKIFNGGTWYPQVVGSADNDFRGTDKLAGQTSRYFNGGVSDYELVFSQVVPTCTLESSKFDFTVGEMGRFNVNSNLTGYPAFWGGTKDGMVDAVNIPIGLTNQSDLTYGPFAGDLIPPGAGSTTYTRYFDLKDLAGNTLCRSNTITITIRR